jgi:hypothetical protein
LAKRFAGQKCFMKHGRWMNIMLKQKSPPLAGLTSPLANHG